MIVGNDDINTWLSFRNIPEVDVCPVADINVYEIIDNKCLVITPEALAHIEEVLA